MNNNLRLIINNVNKKNIEEKNFFEKDELKIILDLYAKMVSEGSWKDYGLNISSKQVGFSVFKNTTENALYKICKNFKPKNKNLKYLITDANGKIFRNSSDLNSLLKNIIKKYTLKNCNIWLLYGGRVNDDNSKSIISLDNVDGFLIGGASLSPEKFYKIYTSMG